MSSPFSMNPLPVAAALNLSPLDFSGNARRVGELLRQIRAEIPSPIRPIVVLPGGTLSGQAGDFAAAPWVRQRAREALEEILPASQGLSALVSLPVARGEELWVVADGEARPATRDERGCFSIDGIKAATSLEAAEDADWLVLRDARPVRFGSQRVFIERACRLSQTGPLVVAADALGTQGEPDIFAGGALIASGGKVLARTQRFSYRDGLWCAPATDSQAASLPWDAADLTECEEESYEEFARAISLALLDYMSKCRARGFTLSLSGGADSAAVAVLVLLGRLFGIEELGENDLKERLPSLSRQSDKQGDLASELLTTVYQATANSGEITRSAAEQVARAVGSRHFEFSIESIVESYKGLIAEAIGRPLTWDKDDLPLQNIQARTRAPGVWLLANLSDSLLLSTGNRSEASVGYMTMDGDSCGALSPIAGVSKVFIRKWLLWMEKTGVFLRYAGAGGERFRIPALAAINDQQPTAELRPPEAGQTDEGDLMPYSVLNIIEEGVIRRLGGEELLGFVREKASAVPELSGADRGMFEAWIARFCRMFPRAAWKRRRTAPGFNIDRYSLAPGQGNDLPLLVGDFGQ
ncbi:MAG: hypothetical protein J6S75_15345 [Thermoguttaceae bacterium]|nr:hypothetical protein [Thermoguttaceae bacterium]